MVAGAALLGVGAHLLNALPDLDDDAATGIEGLPHRLGKKRVPLVAAALMVAATALLVVANSSTWWLWAGLAVVVVTSGATMRMPGRAPFYGAIAVAAINVAMLLLI
jgi:4-hydroxybenzoate polyprenyltransferase